ncbi:MAG: DAK2 domain-containing protein [Lachnospiraceae bacterium]|uniref:DAK2 domain-containing protein n=1 Tax=Clostridium fessum TaxID=2126740 RepID=UPI002A32621F|nr:DAK2 domain-containing protein [Clostridium fessum]MCI5958917.1 DAK2 domain-containing protein [Lachnospiraceae bacterium]MDD5853873.1 DAK2 domain-containing protein [Lachnospiraceae bacterium]MDY4927891.1 DAK2 domain-containing protein [Clostridium fessum]
MAANTIDNSLLCKMFLAGAKNLEANKEYINELNVFPVPDGDTGTNMTMTIMSAAKDVAGLDETTEMKVIAKAISSGSLRGARGNSGVILSQLCRGFAKIIGDVEVIDKEVLARACERAVESAYKAVMKPKEGTILTVAKGLCEKVVELSADPDIDLDTVIDSAIVYAKEVLDKTPDMLPVLKQAGVVDSGGYGLVVFLSGAQSAFRGEEIDFTLETPAVGDKPAVDSKEADTADIKFGYCTEFIILLDKAFNNKMEKDFKAFLESIGDSIVLVADEEIVKVHVHTNDPGLAIQRALTYGALSNMKIDNMRLEHQEKLFKEKEKAEAASKEQAMEHKEVGFISVSVGDGINDIFKDLGVDRIIEGGQTMNPSTDDILKAIDQVNADTVFILPNNKNIIMAANQAQDMVEDKKVIVIPTKNIPQGITAIISYVPEMSAEENAENMKAEIENVRTGQVTYAVRDTEIDGMTIHENDIMGIGDHKMLAVGTEVNATTKEMIDKMIEESDAELISIYYGADIPADAAEALVDAVSKEHSDCDVELQHGGQPVYYYIVSVE